MIYTDNLQFTTFGACAPNRLVAVFDREFSVGMTLTDENGDKRLLSFADGSNYVTIYEDNHRVIADLGSPVVRFDHTSEVDPHQFSKGGLLVVSADAVGFLGENQATRRSLSTLTGPVINYYFQHPAKAFSRWELGLAGDEKFEAIIRYGYND